MIYSVLYTINSTRKNSKPRLMVVTSNQDEPQMNKSQKIKCCYLFTTRSRLTRHEQDWVNSFQNCPDKLLQWSHCVHQWTGSMCINQNKSCFRQKDCLLSLQLVNTLMMIILSISFVEATRFVSKKRDKFLTYFQNIFWVLNILPLKMHLSPK